MYRIARALHIDSNVPGQPLWDTLTGIANPYAAGAQVTIHCYGLDGREVPKSPLIFTLQPGHSIANTFIKNNTFPDPPQNWQGHLTIGFAATSPFGTVQDLPTMACLGGNGPTPLNWNYATPTAPILGSSQQTLGPGTRWVFPYAIPYFDDPVQHHDVHSYRTGLSITNLDTKPANLTLVYTVSDTYPQQGQQFTTTLEINPGATAVGQLHEMFPVLAGFNSEGWLDITHAQPVSLMMYLLAANSDYQYLGFSQSPWILA